MGINLARKHITLQKTQQENMQYISFLPFTTLGRGISCINHSNRGMRRRGVSMSKNEKAFSFPLQSSSLQSIAKQVKRDICATFHSHLAPTKRKKQFFFFMLALHFQVISSNFCNKLVVKRDWGSFLAAFFPEYLHFRILNDHFRISRTLWS